jgi:anthranilate synthase/phosphoribosyltransferase
VIAIIDNYDSFTYNIYQEISVLTDETVRVFRNDKITVEELVKISPSRIIISPGPGFPADAGISIRVIREFAGKVPILGVCLGHQAIAESFGGKIVQAAGIVHGKVEKITLDGRGLFRNLPAEAEFTRYHSLAAERASLPDFLEVTAESGDGEIMGIRHREYVIEGVQFHPESIGCVAQGREIFRNFLRYKREPLEKTSILEKLQARESLSLEDASDFMDELTEGALSPVFTSAVLSLMTSRQVTAKEIAGFAGVLKRKKSRVDGGRGLLDTCGTGGDGRHTFNISSLSAIIASACGARVAKHGNRAVSSKSGSTEFYSALGIDFNISPQQAAELLKTEGFAYLAAPIYHGAMAHAAPVRKELGIRTVMNLLGPLVNPAETDYQLIGVYSKDLCPVMARAAKMLGVKRVMTVSSEDGLDELSPAAATRVFLIDEQGNESDTVFDPAEAGFSGFKTEELRGGSGAENAAEAERILAGGGSPALRAACILNAGAALTAAGLADSIPGGCRTAAEAIDSGRAAERLQSIVRKTSQPGLKNAG